MEINVLSEPKGGLIQALAMGFLTALIVLLTINGPGLTIDEPLDVRPGRAYLAALQAQGGHFLDRAVVDRVYGDNAEHPPLGRWLLGLASRVGEPLETLVMGPDPTGTYVIAARVAPALSFAVLVGLVTFATASRYGRPAGVGAGFALLIMPRIFAHAHLAALDTFLNLFWTAALLAAARALDHRPLPRRFPALGLIGAGGLLGLALLTKIHAWFLLPIVLVWAWSRLGLFRGTACWSLWAAAGLAVFFLGWPWLWYDTVARLARYWGTGVNRVALQVQYFGHIYLDHDVPWHYPWFYFASYRSGRSSCPRDPRPRSAPA